MFLKRTNWIILTFLSLSMLFIAYKMFASTFPIVNINFDMSRNDSLVKADSLASLYQIGPKDKYQVTVFGLKTNYDKMDGTADDHETMEKNFIELGNPAQSTFIDILNEGYYYPYNWLVRHYYPGNINEATFRFTPSGEVYGFEEILSEDLFLSNLTLEDSKSLAIKEASNKWNINIDNYEFIEKKKEEKSSGRIDRTFVYRLKDKKIGDDGEFRLDLVISGNKLTKVDHYIKIPESFIDRYTEMRSSNNTIAIISSIAMMVFYMLGGIIFGLFLLNRERWIIWKPAIYWALIISIITMVSGLNFLPFSWFEYKPAIDSTLFFKIQLVVYSLLGFLQDFLVILLSFVAAESLTRKAFPKHIQFWKLWVDNNAATLEVIGRTMGGYLMVGLDIFFVIVFYFITANYFGWWVPSEILSNPNYIATPFPWLSAVGLSLHAGFWEECLFRAIPISCAVLLSKKYGNRTLWITAAMILQAVIFAGAHANYPSYPAYSRLIELIIPSLFWGFVYIRFGLLPVIISHFAYDVVWFSLPIFASESSNLLFDKFMVVFLTLIPVWIILRSRLKAGSTFSISSNYYNSSFVPLEITKKTDTQEDESIEYLKVSKNYKIILIVLFVTSFLSLAKDNFNEYSNLNINKTRNEAINIANNHLLLNGIEISDEWSILSQLNNGRIDNKDKFIWEKEGKEVYDSLLGSYLDNALWRIRYVHFTGDLEDKAEEYSVYINHDGTVNQIVHKLSESREGVTLDEVSARILAKIYINENFSLVGKDINEVKFASKKVNDSRMDWMFSFSDNVTYPLTEGDLRIDINIAGNKVIESNRYIHIPETWVNEESNSMAKNSMISIISGVLLMLIFLYGVASSISKWSNKKFNVKLFKNIFIITCLLTFISFINTYPQEVSTFDPTKPFFNEFITFIGLSLIRVLVVSFSLSVIMGNIVNNLPKSTHHFNYIEIILIAFSIIGYTALATSHNTQLVPYWFTDVRGINAYFPFLENLTINLMSYFKQVVFLLFIVMLLNKISNYGRKFIIMLLLILFLVLIYTSSLLGQNIGIDTPLHIIKGTFWLGIIFAVLYSNFFRFDISCIPLCVAIILSSSLFVDSSTGMYPGIMATNIISGIIIIMIGYILRKFLIVYEN